MILSLVAGVLVCYGATYGGSLVYDYQFNVESLDGSTAWEETESDQMPGDKTRDQLSFVFADREIEIWWYLAV